MILDTTHRVSTSRAKNGIFWGFGLKLSRAGSQRCSSIRGEELGAGLGAPTMPPAVLGQEHKAGPRCVCQVSSLREGGPGGQRNQELV